MMHTSKCSGEEIPSNYITLKQPSPTALYCFKRGALHCDELTPVLTQ